MTAKTERKFYYANGFQLSQARKMCRFVFSIFYVSVEWSEEKEGVFVITVYNRILEEDKGEEIEYVLEDYVDIERFKKEFCSTKQWELKIVQEVK